MCVKTRIVFILRLDKSIKDLLRFRTKIFPGETTEVFEPVRGNEPVEVAATLHSRT